ncbi:MAG TPA: hypothetical protein EYO78_10955, partial [Gammaproteobacteria bacterium]|nr:hypothetical protein [Gammaproteobacteria bacterium]
MCGNIPTLPHTLWIDPMTDYRAHRPTIMGTTHMVCAGHNLAAAAGYRILEEGGNAIDAGVAAGIAINVVLPENTNFGGVAPIMVYLAETNSIVTISGLGRWPRAASIDYFNQKHDGRRLFLPEGGDLLRGVTDVDGQRARAPPAGQLASGIYQALVTTVGGLLVAIPALAAFAVF